MRLLPVVLATGAGLLIACSPEPRAHLTHSVTTLNRGNGAEITSLDPDYVTGTWEAYVAGDCLMGLTTEGPDGSPIPGAAVSWQTSRDGRTWTFHLRDHLWSDGIPVTADDFVFAWRRLLEPKRGAQYASYLWIVKNARAVSSGTMPGSSLGISAPNDKTLVIQLDQPAPYLTEWLMHQTTYPVPRHVVLAKGDSWASVGNFVGNGAYVPKEWIPNGHLTLVKNPRFYDAKNVHIETVNYYPTQDNQAALKQMQAGELDLQEPLPISEIDWLRRNMADRLVMKPYLGNSYIVINMKRPQFADRRVRKAMSMALDRETLTNRVLKLRDPAAYSFVPPLTANYPSGASLDFARMPYPARLAAAQALMIAAGYGPGTHFHTIYLTTATPDAKLVAATFQAMLRRAFIDIDIVSADQTSYYRTLGNHDFDLAISAWIGDFNDASTFLGLFTTGDGNNYGSYSNPAFDRIYAAAQQQVDLRTRGQMMRTAEQIILNDDAIIPIRFRSSLDLVQPYVKGWRSERPNIRNVHHTRWLWLDAKGLQ